MNTNFFQYEFIKKYIFSYREVFAGLPGFQPFSHIGDDDRLLNFIQYREETEEVEHRNSPEEGS